MLCKAKRRFLFSTLLALTGLASACLTGPSLVDTMVEPFYNETNLPIIQQTAQAVSENHQSRIETSVNKTLQAGGFLSSSTPLAQEDLAPTATETPNLTPALMRTLSARLTGTAPPAELTETEGPSTPTNTQAAGGIPTVVMLESLVVPTIDNNLPLNTPLAATPVVSIVEYDCELLDQTPKIGTELNPWEDFDARWTIKNKSAYTWTTTTTKFSYANGTPMHKYQDSYSIKKSVRPGEEIELIVDMLVPSEPGRYSTSWVLRYSTRTACILTATIYVR